MGKNNFDPEQDIAHYTCLRTRSPIVVDGKLDEDNWAKVLKSPRFVDVIGGTPGIYDTRSALLWDNKFLYVAFWCEEPFVEAHLSQRDLIVCEENDVEVFIDGEDSYYELEINALNTIFEVFYIWKDAYKKGGRFDVEEFDVLEQNALVFGGNNDRYTFNYFFRTPHPKFDNSGNRWAFFNWDFPGLKTAVYIDGKINDSSVIDKGWTIEVAFPWDGMKWLSNGRSLPPEHGDIWKIFLGRYEKFYMNGKNIHAGWAWNKVGTVDNHYPERFTRIQFSENCVEDL